MLNLLVLLLPVTMAGWNPLWFLFPPVMPPPPPCLRCSERERDREVPLFDQHPDLLMVCDPLISPQAIYTGIMGIMQRTEDAMRKCRASNVGVHRERMADEVLPGSDRVAPWSQLRSHPIHGSLIDTLTIKGEQLIWQAQTKCFLDLRLLMKIQRVAMKMLINQYSCMRAQRDMTRHSCGNPLSRWPYHPSQAWPYHPGQTWPYHPSSYQPGSPIPNKPYNSYAWPWHLLWPYLYPPKGGQSWPYTPNASTPSGGQSWPYNPASPNRGGRSWPHNPTPNTRGGQPWPYNPNRGGQSWPYSPSRGGQSWPYNPAPSTRGGQSWPYNPNRSWPYSPRELQVWPYNTWPWSRLPRWEYPYNQYPQNRWPYLPHYYSPREWYGGPLGPNGRPVSGNPSPCGDCDANRNHVFPHDRPILN